MRETKGTKRKLGLLLIFIGAILLGLLFLHRQMQRQRDALLQQAVVQETPTPTPTQSPTPTDTPTPTPTEIPVLKAEPEAVDAVVDFDSLWKINPDAYAYLVIPDTVISYPILQSTEDEEDYYLEHTFERAAGLPGSIYTRMETKKDFSDSISVVYGHDMLDGSYFGSLREYVEEDYRKQHTEIYVYLPEKRLDYTVLAVGVYGDESITAKFDCTKEEAVQDFLEDLASRGEILPVKTDLVEEEEKLLVLSTCIGSRPDNRRLVVARLEETHRTIQNNTHNLVNNS